jgi:hypothetical protein
VEGVAIDGAGAPATLAAAETVLLVVQAHAERGDARGRPLIAAATVEVPLPLGEDREAAAIAAKLRWRAAAAAAVAADDAAGQLLARALPDAAVLRWLEAPRPWQQAAALREVGERGLRAALPTVRQRAAGSRPDLALIAAATLGRLRDAGGLDALRAALAHSQLEVADAACLALAELPGTAARRLLAEAAREHPQRWIRQRARGLLGSGAGPAGAPADAGAGAEGREP